MPESAANERARKPRIRRRAILLLPAAILLTTLGLVALRLHFQPPTVPRYALAGFAAAQTAPIDLGRRDHFEMVMRPSAPVVGAVAARAFLLRGREVRPWRAPFEVARDGTVRIDGSVGALFAGTPAGEWDVAVAVGRPETLPTLPAQILHARDADAGAQTSAWRLVIERVRLQS